MQHTYFRRVDDWSSVVQSSQIQFGTVGTLSFLWAFQVVLLFKCVSRLWRRRGVNSRMLLAFSIILFLLATYWNITAILLSSAFMFNAKFPIPSVTWFKLLAASNVASSLTSFLAEGFMVWRCCAVLVAGLRGPNRTILNLLQVILWMGFLGSYATTGVYVLAGSAPPYVFSIVTIAIHSALTTIIALRLWQYKHQNRLSSSIDRPFSSPFDFASALFIESASMYTMWMIALLIMTGANFRGATLEFSDLYYATVSGLLRPSAPWDLYNYVYFCSPAVQAASVYLVIFRLSNGHAVSKETVVDPIVLSDNFVGLEKYSDDVYLNEHMA